MSFFKPNWMLARTVVNLLDERIAEGVKAHISNQGTAEHYQALADGNLKTLSRLHLQRAAEVEATAVKPVKVHKVRAEPATVTVTKTPRLTAAK